MRLAGWGFFPLDERWQVSESVYSPERAKQMVWLAATRSYAEAAETFERIARRAVPATSIWQETQRHGARLQQHVERQQAQVACW